MTYSYRKAGRAEGDAIFKLYCLVMRRSVSQIWVWDERWQKNDFFTHFDPEGITLVCRGRELIGYSQVENRDQLLFLRMIVVHPHHQRKGIGARLLGSVINSGREQSRKIGLEVFKINDEAKKFYEGYGFSVEGDTAHSYIMGLMPDSSVDKGGSP